MNVNLNLRDEMSEWIKDYGITVLYQRSSKYIRCKCFDSLYQSGKTSCKLCNGTGKTIKTEKLKIMNSEVYPPNRRNRVMPQTQVGEVYTTTMVFYFEYNKPPKTKDIIYIVGWDKGRATNVISVYEIISYQVYRGEGGRVEFYVANTQLKPQLLDRGQEYINELR